MQPSSPMSFSFISVPLGVIGWRRSITALPSTKAAGASSDSATSCAGGRPAKQALTCIERMSGSTDTSYR